MNLLRSRGGSNRAVNWNGGRRERVRAFSPRNRTRPGGGARATIPGALTGVPATAGCDVNPCDYWR